MKASNTIEHRRLSQNYDARLELASRDSIPGPVASVLRLEAFFFFFFFLFGSSVTVTRIPPEATRHASPPPAVEPEPPPGGSDAKTTFPAGDIPRGNMESGAKTIFPAGDIPRGNMFVAPARGDRGFPTELQPTFSRGCVGVVSGWFRRTPPRASSGW